LWSSYLACCDDFSCAMSSRRLRSGGMSVWSYSMSPSDISSSKSKRRIHSPIVAQNVVWYLRARMRRGEDRSRRFSRRVGLLALVLSKERSRPGPTGKISARPSLHRQILREHDLQNAVVVDVPAKADGARATTAFKRARRSRGRRRENQLRLAETEISTPPSDQSDSAG